MAIRSPIILLVAILLLIAMAAIIHRRHGWWNHWLIILAAALLALAAGDLVWRRPAVQRVAVMVDLSPSTRGAGFRDAKNLALRIHQLLNDVPFDLIGLGQENRPLQLGEPLAEMPAEYTVFHPPAAAAVLLFSDCRFEIPAAAPPTYVVADAGLEDVADGRVDRLEIRQNTLAATAVCNGTPREIRFAGVIPATTRPVPVGASVVTATIGDANGSISAELNPQDRWPENDALEIAAAPPMASQRWWVGGKNVPAGWRAISPGDLPADAGAYLPAAIIVLDNVADESIAPAARQRLAQYVQQLGGSLLILAGQRDSAGFALEEISPLSSTPPRPTTQWIILTDCSGSMADASAGDPAQSNWSAASAAAVGVLKDLPPDDPVTLGQFSDDVRWWIAGQSAREAAQQALPPADAQPQGPTNLQAALLRIADESTAKLPTQLLLLSDCDTTFTKADEVAAKLAARQIHLSVLAIGQGSALATVAGIAQKTGGQVMTQFDSHAWAAGVMKLMRAGKPERWASNDIRFLFHLPGAADEQLSVAGWNRSWLKSPATSLVSFGGNPPDGAALAATWQAGVGKVTALAFEPSNQDLLELTAGEAQLPRDPRYSVVWDAAAKLRVTVDAIQDGKFLNGLSATLSLFDPNAGDAKFRSTTLLRQTQPGRYVAELPAPRQPVIAELQVDSHTVDRAAIAGRYAPEFDAVGNDHAAMQLLARRSGGAIITPAQNGAIHFRWPRREISLSPWLGLIAAVLILTGLIQRKRG